MTFDLLVTLSNIDELVLFDLFIETHDIGHILGSGHTFDEYEPPVDVCGSCTVTPVGGELARNGESVTTIDGLPRENSVSIMSYYNFCECGLINIATTMGGVWDGTGTRANIDHWENHPDIIGSVSNEPKRVLHNIWSKLDSKSCLLNPSPQTLASQGCNDHSDGNDNNMCTIDICDESNLCTISETLEFCCGNEKCELGEGQSCRLDCGAFEFDAPNVCEEKKVAIHLTGS